PHAAQGRSAGVVRRLRDRRAARRLAHSGASPAALAMTDIVCVGDLMVECIVHDAPWPGPNATLVVDSPGQVVGGSAFNTCWTLAPLGHAPRLVAPSGAPQATIVRDAFAAAKLPGAGLIETTGDTDLLVVVAREGASRSVYLREP